MKELWLAFEGGGTKTRAILADTSGNVLAREVGGSSSGLYIRRGTYARNTRFLLKRIQRAADAVGGRVTTVGLGAPMVTDLVMEVIESVFGPVKYVGTSEAEMAFANHGLTWGISMVAGTGSSCVAKNERAEWCSCGGFGPQFGDEGSGAWLGRRAIATVMKSVDGREPETILRQRLCAFYELGSIFEIYRFNDHSGYVPAPKIASCVPEIYKAAAEGDVVAIELCTSAGEALGAIIEATAAIADFRDSPIPLVLAGGVFHGGPLIIDPLRRRISESVHHFNLYPEITEPGEGIFRIIEKTLKEEKDGVPKPVLRRRRRRA